MVVYQLLVVSWLIKTLFSLFVKYNHFRANELVEKPCAVSLLISRERYSESNAFNILVDKSPILIYCSQ